ncbi:hypothetical protein DPMN_000660 [Dreissena polymorpha]|uniref:ATP-dependent RNA helicase n=2 Tax=Dreissena polymorpha TaxID=45954 RepID=A0A9D4RS84_DREPO|nr:hypothetical protein DPMN_000660 [Dreissena polymorpha]
MKRYLGEDEDVNQDQKAASILRKLKKEAKKRKRLSAGVQHNVHAQTSDTEGADFLLDTKGAVDLVVQENNTDDHIKDDESNRVPRQKRKRKHLEEPVDISNATQHIKDIVDETVKSKKHKTKKKQKNEDDSSVDNETVPQASGSHKSLGEHDDVAESLDDVNSNVQLHSGIEGLQEIGGFTVIGDLRPAKVEKVRRVLPEWLSNPHVISADLTTDQLPVQDMPGLAPDLVQQLLDNNITHFFPVQKQVIPALLESSLSGFHIGRAGYQPSDICVSAPTGSGKTLAYVIPIVQALRSRVTCRVRALAVLPVTDLAAQVFKVFQTYSGNTCLKVGLLIGQKTFTAEQKMLTRKTLCGYRSQYDIIVATPGRLVDHINKTEGFDLSQLRYLVIDEADRMMEEIKQDWLVQVEAAVHRSRPSPGPLSALACRRMVMPLQKLLYSATLSQNPEKLQQLNLFQPKLYTSVIGQSKDHVTQEAKPDVVGSNDRKLSKDKQSKMDEDEDFVGKYATPASLSEYYIEAAQGEKPLIVVHLLHNLHYKNILCFTNSVEDTHRLSLLIKLVGGVKVKEFSSRQHVTRRNDILEQFAAGKIDILICSDAMARGMDVSNVKYVISYDPPSYIQNYIHRVGRTARAGQPGTAITLVQRKQFYHFKKMLRDAGKSSLLPLHVTRSDFGQLLPKYEVALKKLEEMLEVEKQKRTPKAKTFKKNDQNKPSNAVVV